MRDKIDRRLLHKFLWEHRDRYDRIAYSQNELAEMLDIHFATMSLILKEMAENGRLVKIRKGTWKVVDPQVYAFENKTEDTLF